MPLISNHREAIAYVADNATTYKVTAEAALATQTALGGVVAAGTEPNLLPEIRPRRAAFRTSGLTPNVTRELTIYTPTAYAALTTASTVNVNHGTTAVTMTHTGHKTAEHTKVRNVTLQIT